MPSPGPNAASSCASVRLDGVMTNPERGAWMSALARWMGWGCWWLRAIQGWPRSARPALAEVAAVGGAALSGGGGAISPGGGAGLAETIGWAGGACPAGAGDPRRSAPGGRGDVAKIGAGQWALAVAIEELASPTTAAVDLATPQQRYALE